jgi:hypothetical protein
MTEQSPAAIHYAFEDAQADIIELAEQLERMKLLLSRIAYPARNTPDDFADLNMFAAEIQATWSMEHLKANVKEHAPPLAGASVETGGDA